MRGIASRKKDPNTGCDARAELRCRLVGSAGKDDIGASDRCPD